MQCTSLTMQSSLCHSSPVSPPAHTLTFYTSTYKLCDRLKHKPKLLLRSTGKGEEIHTCGSVFNSAPWHIQYQHVGAQCYSSYMSVNCALCCKTLGLNCVFVFMKVFFCNACTPQVIWFIVCFLSYHSFCVQRGRQTRANIWSTGTQLRTMAALQTLPGVSVCVWIHICYCISLVCGHLPILEKQEEKKKRWAKGQKRDKDEREEASFTPSVTSPLCGLSEWERSQQLMGG